MSAQISHDVMAWRAIAGI
ncbi:hypothetical protein E2C01_091603 [Portunus trituberculatus]|uniref:Uncharacterized protein n=1 Tax=Portunus trituberculatus TaxID=210409 RepID=A0A5B7JPT9_PORTR|nr:hypothetical protein [Portunus trituberculatus]